MKRWIITENNKPNIDIIEYEEEIKLFRYEKNKIETEKNIGIMIMKKINILMYLALQIIKIFAKI
jgi:hypothetical protein